MTTAERNSSQVDNDGSASELLSETQSCQALNPPMSVRSGGRDIRSQKGRCGAGESPVTGWAPNCAGRTLSVADLLYVRRVAGPPDFQRSAARYVRGRRTRLNELKVRHAVGPGAEGGWHTYQFCIKKIRNFRSQNHNIFQTRALNI